MLVKGTRILFPTDLTDFLTDLTDLKQKYFPQISQMKYTQISQIRNQKSVQSVCI